MSGGFSNHVLTPTSKAPAVSKNVTPSWKTANNYQNPGSSDSAAPHSSGGGAKPALHRWIVAYSPSVPVVAKPMLDGGCVAMLYVGELVWSEEDLNADGWVKIAQTTTGGSGAEAGPEWWVLTKWPGGDDFLEKLTGHADAERELQVRWAWERYWPYVRGGRTFTELSTVILKCEEKALAEERSLSLFHASVGPGEGAFFRPFVGAVEGELRKWFPEEEKTLKASKKGLEMSALGRGETAAGAELALDKAISIQDDLLSEYGDEEFQRQLHLSWEEAGEDAKRWKGMRGVLCLEVQKQVAVKHGYEDSRKGVFQSHQAFTPDLNEMPEVRRKNRMIAWLIDPGTQARFPSGPQGET